MITKEDIEKRINELKNTKQTALAQVYAVDGAIQHCEFFLQLIEQKSKVD